MKQTIFTDILTRWKGLSQKEKLALLQKFEEVNAKFEKREEREVIIDKKLPSSIRAEYRFKEPTFLFLNSDFHQYSPAEGMDSVFHEGFHALVDDFFHDKANLRTFTPIDKDRFMLEYALRDIIYERLKHEGALALFAYKYYEESLVRFETCLYFIYNLLRTCENLNDCTNMFIVYADEILGMYYNYQKTAHEVEKVSKYPYDTMVAIALKIDQFQFANKINPIETSKTITSPISPKVLAHFEENFKIFVQIQQLSNNKHLVAVLSQKLIENVKRDLIPF